MTIEQQIYSIIAMFLSSFAIGSIFDGYRVAKNKITLPKWIVFIIDIGFGISSALFTFYLLLWANNGQLRFMIFVFFVIGIWFYYLILSKYIIIFWTYILKVIYNVWKAIIHFVHVLIVKPFQFSFQLLLSFIIVIVTGVSTAISFLLSNIAIMLKKILIKLPKRNKSRNPNGKKEGILKKLKNLFRRNKN